MTSSFHLTFNISQFTFTEVAPQLKIENCKLINASEGGL
jgi:hypothetical protein